MPAAGTLMVLDPVVAQSVGARDHEGVARGVQRGVLLAVLLAVFTSLLLLPIRPVLAALHARRAPPARRTPDAARIRLRGMWRREA